MRIFIALKLSEYILESSHNKYRQFQVQSCSNLSIRTFSNFGHGLEVHKSCLELVDTLPYTNEGIFCIKQVLLKVLTHSKYTFYSKVDHLET